MIWSTDLFKPTGRISKVPCDPTWADIEENFKLQQGSYWTQDRIKFDKDIITFPKLPANLQHSVRTTLSFFAGSDEIVEDIISHSDLQKITIPEIRQIYNFEAMMEDIHSNTYNLTILAYEPDAKRRHHLLHSVEHVPAVIRKANWAKQWISPQRNIDYTLVGKACVEGINFSSSFALIDWLATQDGSKDLYGLFEGNSEISRDEARHTDTSVLIHKKLNDKLSPGDAMEIIRGSVDVEKEFIHELIPPEGFNGMNRDLMYEHVKHCANKLSQDLGYEKIYNIADTPFQFMTRRGIDGKVNMFEKRRSEYVFNDQDVSNFDEVFDPNFQI